MRPPSYWNHNVAYHRELLQLVAVRGGRVLDVGCGEGLLLERLAPLASEVVGVEQDPESAARARRRRYGTPNSRVLTTDFLAPEALSRDDTERGFDTVLCVAALHHMPLVPALRKAAELLVPGGTLSVVGLAADRSVWDHTRAVCGVLPIRLLGLLHHETADIGVPTAPPRESLAEIRQAASSLLPGAHLRRRLYYRYTLNWTKPGPG